MPLNPTTGVFTRVDNSFSEPVNGTVIDPTDALALFNDYDSGLDAPVMTNGQLLVGQNSAIPLAKTVSGDATIAASGALTLASTVVSGGPIGSATVTPIITYDAKGRLTTVSSATITPAIGSISGLGTGIATALGVNVGSPGSPILANLTGDVTSSNSATTITNNAVTNAKSAQMTAATLKGNPTASTANSSDFTIQGLVTLGSTSSTLDFVPIYDHLTGTIKSVTPGVLLGSGGLGDVVGPSSATDNAITRYDGTTGKIVQNSGILIDDSNNVTGANSVQFATSKGIADDSGNNQLLFVKTASAVNYLTATNAATGTAPKIAAIGSDSNIGFNIAAKGTAGYTSILDDLGAVAIQFQPNPVGAGTSSYLMYRPGYSSGATSGNNPEFDVIVPAGSPVTNQGVSFRGIGAWFHAFHSTVTGKSKVKLYPANTDTNGVLLTTATSMSGSYEFAFPAALGSTNDVLYDTGSGFMAMGRPPTVAKAVGNFTSNASPAFNQNVGFNSSITKSGAGDYTLTLLSATTDVASVIHVTPDGGATALMGVATQPSTTTIRVRIYDITGTLTDPTRIMVSVHGF